MPQPSGARSHQGYQQITVREHIKGAARVAMMVHATCLSHCPMNSLLEGLTHVIVDVPHGFFSPRDVTQDRILPCALNRSTVQGDKHRFFFFCELESYLLSLIAP